MDDIEKKKIILDFISKQSLAVLSTSQNDQPQSAVLEFGETKDLELVFDTFTSSRKYENLLKNNKVAFVIGWDESITVQYEGIANELTSKESEAYKKVYWEKNPDAKKWEKREGITFFKVTPTWIRYSDLHTDPWTVFEIKF